MGLSIENIVACSPFRGGDPHRELSRVFIDSAIRGLGIKTYYGTSDDDQFNRAAAKNAAVRSALSDNPSAEILVIFDADTFVDRVKILLGIIEANHHNRLVLPFTWYRWLPETEAGNVYAARPYKTFSGWADHVGGIVILPVYLWEIVGGYDERFRSWGGEDRAFYFACNAILGYKSAVRHSGEAHHLWHSRGEEMQPENEGYRFAVDLGSRYKLAAGVTAKTGILPEIEDTQIEPDPETMKNILSEDGAPLSANQNSIGRPCTEKDLECNSACFVDDKGKSLIINKNSEQYQRLSENPGKWGELKCM